MTAICADRSDPTKLWTSPARISNCRTSRCASERALSRPPARGRHRPAFS